MRDPALTDFIRKRPTLIWYSKDYDNMPEESIVEHTLNYGGWDDFTELVRIMGMRRAADIFRKQMMTGRQKGNYYPEVRRYFELYFNKHAPSA